MAAAPPPPPWASRPCRPLATKRSEEREGGKGRARPRRKCVGCAWDVRGMCVGGAWDGQCCRRAGGGAWDGRQHCRAWDVRGMCVGGAWVVRGMLATAGRHERSV